MSNVIHLRGKINLEIVVSENKNVAGLRAILVRFFCSWCNSVVKISPKEILDHFQNIHKLYVWDSSKIMEDIKEKVRSFRIERIEKKEKLFANRDMLKEVNFRTTKGGKMKVDLFCPFCVKGISLAAMWKSVVNHFNRKHNRQLELLGDDRTNFFKQKKEFVDSQREAQKEDRLLESRKLEPQIEMLTIDLINNTNINVVSNKNNKNKVCISTYCPLCQKDLVFYESIGSIVGHIFREHFFGYLLTAERSKRDGMKFVNWTQSYIFEKLGAKIQEHYIKIKRGKAVLKEEKEKRIQIQVRQNQEKSQPEIKPIELNEQQKKVCDLVQEGKSICFTGSAGTGKSFLLNYIIKELRGSSKKVGVTSTTGKGAEIIGGSTLHSYLGIGRGDFLEPISYISRLKFRGKEMVRNNWLNTQVLIIDEISMLDGKLFDKLNKIAQILRRSEEPFGGMQLVLVGDFCQLPPVGKESIFCFEAESWGKCVPMVINLSQVYRQKEGWFLEYLEAIRFGKLGKKQWENILSWLGREPNWPQDGIKPVSLYSTKLEVGNINEKELAELLGEARFFKAYSAEKEVGKIEELKKNVLVSDRLELKVGAQVMLVKNWPEQGLVNGSQGTVLGFEKESDGLPIVKFTNKKELVVEPHTWDKIEGYDKNDKPIISASYTQIPLILAWAITIHKSQGQTIERLKVDLNRCFEVGHVYVALSRACDTRYLQVVNFPFYRMWCDKRVKNYYKRIGEGLFDYKPVEVSERQPLEYWQTKVKKLWQDMTKKHQFMNDLKEEIKNILREQNQQYFDYFVKVIERSISNRENLTSYPELVGGLKTWWGEERGNVKPIDIAKKFMDELKYEE